ncbi:MAG: 50S ribosomal protein L35 [Candidatus Moranbacteria bacterium]|nr:50S ribosomal protein L35 [Candidatus Moranbacteria bacterium]
MKQKTKKSVAKKIMVTGSGKLMRRATGQNHYNSRYSGTEISAKRRDVGFKLAKEEQNTKRALPYA